MSKFLLREYHALCPNGACDLTLLTEAEKKMKAAGECLLSGVMQVASQKNGNGRIYKKDTLAREMENYQRLIQERRAVGTLDHEDSSVIELKNVSHMVLRTWWEGDKVMGVIKLLETPMGKTARSLVEGGVQLGISSRSLGSLTEGPEGSIVNDDLVLLSFDLVQEPSAPGAFMNLREAKERELRLSKDEKIYRAILDVLHTRKSR